MNVNDALGTFTHSVIGYTHAAADATRESLIWVAPSDVTVTKVEAHFPIAVTAHATNYTNLNVGSVTSTTSTATDTELGNIDHSTATTDDRVAGDIEDFGITATNLAAGNSLIVEYEKAGTGVALGAVGFTVTYRNQ